VSDNNGLEERGIAAVADGKKGGGSNKVKVVVLLIAAAGLGGLTLLRWQSEPKAVEKKEAAVKTGEVRKLDLVEQRVTPPVTPVAAEAAPPVVEEKEDKLSESARRAPVMAFKSAGSRKAAEPAAADAADGRTPKPPVDPASLQSKLQPTVITGVRASALENLHAVVPQGTHIPCVLETAMSSDQPGFVTCIVQRDVLSASGQVVLMEKGTQVTGEYQAGIERGQSRIFVLWARARTPTGVIVNLASPATDALGRGGFTGEIDHKFWDRFGGALLLSIVKDGMGFLANQLQDRNGGGTQVQLNSIQGASRDGASIAVEQSINIKPTLYKNQGELVSIFVARDLDFSTVYQLRRVETKGQIYDRTVSGDMTRGPAPPLK
jgi:type IV secretion system protein VirB10